MSATLIDQAEAYAADITAVQQDRAKLKRAYLAGALAAATDRRPREHVVAELVQYGRTIGTAAEAAR